MKFSAVLFAGGKSRRMGRDKADLLIGGIPLWRRQIEILRETGADEIFVSGPNRPDWRDAGLTIVADDPPDAGPFGGMVPALRHAAHPRLLVLAVDMPAMTSDFLKELVASVDERAGVVPKIGERYEPLAALYPTGSLTLAEKCLERGTLSLQAFVSQAITLGFVHARPIASFEHPLFLNVNIPNDLAKIATP